MPRGSLGSLGLLLSLLSLGTHLLDVPLSVALAYNPTPAATASECPVEMPESETDRVHWFRRIYGSWPPAITLPGKGKQAETEGWREYHRRKEARLMQIEDIGWRWERWLEQAQIRSMVNFTARGWALGRMPDDVHRRVREAFLRGHGDGGGGGYDEGEVAGYITGRRNMVPMHDVHALVTETIHRLVSEWSGVPPADLEPTSTYGIRVYYRNSTLNTHVDRVETHILSAVYCVDAQYAPGEPKWKMEADPDLSGRHAAVEVKPGQVFFYESAKLAHGRPTVLRGAHSAHIFAHYRPKGWTFSNMDRVYAVPPGWADETGRRHAGGGEEL